MNKTDERIVEALNAEDNHLLADMQEPGFMHMAFGMYRGQNGWLSLMMSVVQVALFVVAVWCGWRFFEAGEPLEALKWGLPAVALVVLSQQIKSMLMMQLQADRVLNALRRMELRQASRW